jgi:hypothetical protein
MANDSVKVQIPEDDWKSACLAVDLWSDRHKEVSTAKLSKEIHSAKTVDKDIKEFRLSPIEYRRFQLIMKRSDIPQIWSTSDIKDLVSAKRGFKSEGKSSDKKNLLSDLEGEHKAINDYDAHIEETNNPVIEKKLQEIRDEEEVHAGELKDLLKNEV